MKRNEVRIVARGLSVDLWDADEVVLLGTVENATMSDILPIAEHDDGTVQMMGAVESTITGYFRTTAGLRSMRDVYYQMVGGLELHGPGLVRGNRGTTPGEIEVVLSGRTHPERRHPELYKR